MSDDVDIAVYRFDGTRAPSAEPSPVRFELWRPSLFELHPPFVPKLTYSVFWGFHQAHVFRNRQYAVLLGYEGSRVVHSMTVFPPYFRFPFMRKNDLQLGNLLTAEDQRGKGIATAAIRRAVELVGQPGRRIFYLSRVDNVPSIRAAERAGFTRVGTAKRTHRFGVRLFGQFKVVT
jgi:RimJ/RimL family protein N-acetyltransferase